MYSIEGNFDIERLTSAIESVLWQNAALRTYIKYDRSTGSISGWETENLAGYLIVTHSSGCKSVKDHVTEAKRCRLNADEVCNGAPLVNFEIRVGNPTVLICKLHHLVSDTWSEALLWKKIRASYCGNSNVSGSSDYASYVSRQSILHQSNSSEACNYWSKKLQGHTVSAEERWGDGVYSNLHDASKLDVHDSSLLVGRKAAQAVHRLARIKKVTPFLVVRCLLSQAVAELTDCRNVLCVSDESDRKLEEYESVIGFMVTTRQLYMSFDKTETVIEAIESARSDWLESLHLKEVYEGQIRDTLGVTDIVKINLTTSLHNPNRSLSLPDANVVRHPVTFDRIHWRPLNIYCQITATEIAIRSIIRKSVLDKHRIDELRRLITLSFDQIRF
ncbi:hypothetical protein KTJ89_06770 [Brevibacterium sediminis]|nr:hypothetical protein [Brevibacterium sediminis]